jgi:hypothetical protein
LDAVVRFALGRPYDRIVSIAPLEDTKHPNGRSGTQRIVVVHTVRSGPWPQLRHATIGSKRCATRYGCSAELRALVAANPNIVVWSTFTDYDFAGQPMVTWLVYVEPAT